MTELPGNQFALDNGYHIYSHSGEPPITATYAKHFDNFALFLRVRKDALGVLYGELSRIISMVECKIDRFSIPSKNFQKFEDQICSLTALKEMELIQEFRKTNNSAVDYLRDGTTFLAVGIDKPCFPTVLELFTKDLKEAGIWKDEFEDKRLNILEEWNKLHK